MDGKQEERGAQGHDYLIIKTWQTRKNTQSRYRYIIFFMETNRAKDFFGSL